MKERDLLLPSGQRRRATLTDDYRRCLYLIRSEKRKKHPAGSTRSCTWNELEPSFSFLLQKFSIRDQKKSDIYIKDFVKGIKGIKDVLQKQKGKSKGMCKTRTDPAKDVRRKMYKICSARDQQRRLYNGMQAWYTAEVVAKERYRKRKIQDVRSAFQKMYDDVQKDLHLKE